ncbi:MAG: DUF1214 domain-containing protein, partial [Pikeienuella sp.]
RAEATYLRHSGVNGRAVIGGYLWRLHCPAGEGLPAASFGSLSLFEPTPEGVFVFVDHEVRRYAIGDRTPGLRHNADGSLDIWISAKNPGADRESNWLPAPPGPFHLFLRAYLPRIELIENRYQVPDPELVEG